MGVLFLSEAYPQLHSVVSALCASMWDSSALVFMFFQSAHFRSQARTHTGGTYYSGNAHTVASRHTRTKLGIGDTAHRWIAHPITHPL